MEYVCILVRFNRNYSNRQHKKVSEYDQEIPQSQTADNPVAPRGRAAQCHFERNGIMKQQQYTNSQT